MPKTLEEGDEEEDGGVGQASEEDVSPMEGSGAEDAAKRESERVSDTKSRGSVTILLQGKWKCCLRATRGNTPTG